MTDFLDASRLLDPARALRTGPISIVAQNAEIGASIAARVQRAGRGLQYLMHSGADAGARIADYLHALVQDDDSRIIAVYLEGSDDGSRLVRALEGARDRGKPVVLIAAGASAVFAAILEELAVIQVGSVEALVDTCLLLASSHTGMPTSGRRVGIATLGETSHVLADDQCRAHGLTPVITELHARAAQDEPDTLLLIVGAAAARAADAADTIRACIKKSSKPVCIGAPSAPDRLLQHLAADGIAAFEEPDRALRALGCIARHVEALAGPRRDDVPAMTFDWGIHVEPGARGLSVDRCHEVLIDAGIPVAPGRIAVDAAAALPIAHEIGLPVTLSGIARQTTEGVADSLLVSDLRSADEVLTAFRRIEDRARAQEIELAGIYVQKLRRDGVALRMTVFGDPDFGLMVSCGSGSEPADALTARAPVSEAFATDMLARLRCARGLDVTAPATLLSRLSQLGATAPWPIFRLEVNPIKWSRSGAVAIAGRLSIG